MEKISFVTSDGVTIAADLYKADGKQFALLLHMMPSNKEGWNAFAMKLVEAGYTCLAIDMRGHGESTMNGTLDYHTFTNEQHQAKRLDAEAAFAYLQTLGATEEHMVLIGGSIGSNLAINFLAQHPVIKKAVALSPSLDYHGVKTAESIKHLGDGQKLLIVTSDNDSESHNDSQQMQAMNADHVDLINLSGAGHAEHMLANRPSLTGEIIDWLAKS